MLNITKNTPKNADENKLLLEIYNDLKWEEYQKVTGGNVKKFFIAEISDTKIKLYQNLIKKFNLNFFVNEENSHIETAAETYWYIIDPISNTYKNIDLSSNQIGKKLNDLMNISNIKPYLTTTLSENLDSYHSSHQVEKLSKSRTASKCIMM